MAGAAPSALPLAGRTAIVTGSGRNIGREIALVLARNGAAVVVNGSRDRAAIDGVVAEIEDAGGQALAVLADVSRPGDVEAMVAAAVARFGSVDIAVSNVGVRRHCAFLDLSVEDWQRAMDQNLGSAFHLARLTLPLMRQRRWGRVILLSGLDAFGPDGPGRAHIVVAKLGLVGLAKALAQEFGPDGITANAVAPGLMATERDWSHFAGFDRAAFEASLPVRRMGTAADVAAAVLYLSSDAGAFITGQTLHVNGGQRMM